MNLKKVAASVVAEFLKLRETKTVRFPRLSYPKCVWPTDGLPPLRMELAHFRAQNKYQHFPAKTGFPSGAALKMTRRGGRAAGVTPRIQKRGACILQDFLKLEERNAQRPFRMKFSDFNHRTSSVLRLSVSYERGTPKQVRFPAEAVARSFSVESGLFHPAPFGLHKALPPPTLRKLRGDYASGLQEPPRLVPPLLLACSGRACQLIKPRPPPPGVGLPEGRAPSRGRVP